MSLINDALKKAGQTGSTPTAETAEPLRLAVHTEPPRWPLFVIPPLLLTIFGLGTLLLVRGWQGSRQNPVGVSARQAEPTTAVSEPVANGVTTLPVLTAPPQTAPTNVATATPTDAAQTGFPNLKVQGIIWSPTRPSVVINGKSLFVGEKVERAKVIAITEESVTVVWNGEERVLTLP